MPPAAHHAEDGGYRARRARRVLCVFPRCAHSFGTFQHAYELMPGVRAFMPPQGILSVAAYLPREWTVRVVDENVRPVSDTDLAWGDAVLVSGMHVQRAEHPARHRGGGPRRQARRRRRSERLRMSRVLSRRGRDPRGRDRRCDGRARPPPR